MHIPRLAIFAIMSLALTAAVLTVDVPGSTAQMNSGSFRALVASLNANDSAAVGSHLAPDFTITFTGGTTMSGAEATTMLMLLDTPIAIVSTSPGGGSKGSAVVTFGDTPDHYTLEYTGARGGKFATITINAPSE